MRTLFWVLTLIVLAVSAALLAHLNPGNVVFFVAPYRVGMSLNLFLAMAVLAFIALYYLWRAIGITLSLPLQVQAYRKERREIKARVAVADALSAFYEGRFARAEKRAQAAVDSDQWAGLAALIAARATHRMQEYERCNYWLGVARADKNLRIATLMTTAELASQARENATGLQALDELRKLGGRHIEPMRLAVRLHQRSGHWTELLQLVRTLHKRDALHPAVVNKLKLQAITHKMQDLQEDPEALFDFWIHLPAEEQLQPEIALAGMHAFQRSGSGGRASRIAEQVLEREWDTRLVDVYGDCFDEQSKQAQIERAEKWLVDHPEDPVLLMTLGRLCARRHLWGKAEYYLSESLHLQPKAKAAFALAQTCEQQDRTEEAARYYKLASGLALGVALDS